MSDGNAIRQDRIRQLAFELWQADGEPQDASDRYWRRAEREIKTEEAAYDKTVDDGFPASDPPANSGIT